MPRPRSSSSRPADRAPQKKHRLPLWLRRTVVATVIIGGMGALGVTTGVAIMLSQIPSVESLLANRPSGETTIYDREGRFVASLQNGENRKLVPLAEIAEPLRQAAIASEDARFYDHWGVDPMGVGRALLNRGKMGGGSTITQQLAKNLFLTPDYTMQRKIADMWLAIQLERTITKDQILEMYLNEAYFGHGSYGVEAASLKYFGKKARAINLAEAAMLVGLLPAPEYYSPYRNPEAAKERQRLVLKRMVESGFIDAATAEQEASRKLQYANTPNYAYRAPYFTSHVLSLLSDRLGQDLVMRGGLKIHTTMDLRLQEHAEQLIKQGVAGYRKMNVGQGALVAVEPGTGAVLALVGGTNYDASQFNRATQAKRQPGSTFKPFVFLTAFQDGFDPAMPIQDEATTFGKYKPQNYDRRFRGEVTLEQALALSLNVPTVKVANTVGIDRVIQLAHRVGVKSEIAANLAVALGAAEVTPLELAAAYATFGAGGEYVEPLLVTRVEDSHGNLIDQFPITRHTAVDANAVAKLNQCLNAAIVRGTGGAANFGRPAAGKTGTTSENRDTWFAGYTPDLATVVWLGNDDNARLSRYATGGGLAAPLWRKFMVAAHQAKPVRPLPMPQRQAETPATGELPLSGATGEATGLVEVAPEPTPTPEPVLEIGGEFFEGEPLPEPLPSALIQTPAPIDRSRATPKPIQPEQPVALPSIIIIQ
ncbi:MAG: transglycosylase domain-containing protein [Candidatus Sericytochromatia bacterium]